MTCTVKDCRRKCRRGWAICDQHVLEMVAPAKPKPQPWTEAELREAYGR